MDRSDLITLEASTYVNDDMGVAQPVTARNDVFCKVGSISLQEAQSGGQAQLREALKFTVLAAEYHSEPVVIFGGRRYSVYRTYRASRDFMELYAEVKAGV